MSIPPNVHKKSTHFHPVTGMYYRERSDGRFEYCKIKYKVRRDIWVISGMVRGFLPITGRRSGDKNNAQQLTRN